nr:hypothetical protein [Caldimonas brevitalea]
MSGTPPPRSAWSWAIWRWPVVLAVLTGVGLVSGLFSDGGLGDAIAGMSLAVPVAASIWFGWRRP